MIKNSKRQESDQLFIYKRTEELNSELPRAVLASSQPYISSSALYKPTLGHATSSQ